MVIVPFSKQELNVLKQKLDRLKMRYKDIGGGREQPEIHDKVEEKMMPASNFAGSKKNKLGTAGQWNQSKNRPARAGDLVGGAAESMHSPAQQAAIAIAKREKKVDEKIKGADGKACWKNYRYNGTANGSDKCVKVREDVENIISSLVEQLSRK